MWDTNKFAQLNTPAPPDQADPSQTTSLQPSARLTQTRTAQLTTESGD